MSNPVMLTRAQSGFPLSIATGLALETILEPTQEVFDASRIVPDRPQPTQYSDYLINVATLVRNIVTSVPFADLQKCNLNDIIETLLQEMDYLKTLFEMQSMQLHFYTHSYSFVHSTYADKLRLPTTTHQLYNFKLLDGCIGNIHKRGLALRFSKNLNLDRASSTLLISHVPWDLLSYTNFKRLDLLESHTGLIKTRKDWNTKYFKIPNKDMSFLPFMEYLLTTFGDGVMLKPSPLKDRETLYNDMLKKKAHPLMSETSLLFSK